MTNPKGKKLFKEPKPLNIREYNLFIDTEYELEVSKFVLPPEARMVLENLRVASMKEKVEVNSLAFTHNPEHLVQQLAKVDIELVTYDYLLELDKTNRTNLEN